MHHTHGSSSFANGRSHPFDTSSPDIAYCEHSWQAAFQHQRWAGKRPRRISIRINLHWQIAPGKDEALLIKSDTALQPAGIGRGASHYEEVMGRDRTHLASLLVDPTHFFELVLALHTG